MLSATLRVLATNGYTKGEDRVDRHKITTAIAKVLLARPVEHADPAEIEQKALIVPEIRSRLFGENGYGEGVEDDLDLLVSQLVGGDAAVQKLLGEQLDGDAYVLCSMRVERQVIGLDGTPTMRLKRSGKFVSRDPDVVEAYYYRDAFRRFEQSTLVVKRRLDTAEARQPALKARRERLMIDAHKAVQMALPVGGEQA